MFNLNNSVFSKDMINNNLRYVDWSEGKVNPKTLPMEDAEKLKNSEKLFARKFNTEVDNKILAYIGNTMHF